MPILLSILQPQQQGARARQPSAPSRQPSSNRQPAATQAEPEETLSPTSSTSSSQHQMEAAEEAGPSKVLEAAVPATASNAQTAPEVSSHPKPTEEEAMETEDVPSSSENKNEDPTPKETLMEQTTRDTSVRLRKTHSGTNR